MNFDIKDLISEIVKKEDEVTLDQNCSTRLLNKHYSPMIIRKYTRLGFPLYVALITDSNLEDLDNIVHEVIDFYLKNNLLKENIQIMRDFVGVLNEIIFKYYDNQKRGSIEGIAIIYYVDKMCISSLHGDFMNHNACRLELYQLLNFMTQV